MTATMTDALVDTAAEAAVEVAVLDGVPAPAEPVLGPTEGRSECAALEAEICALAGDLAAAECRWLLLVAAYDAAEGWRGWECRSAAHWLSWKCGMGLRAAAEKVRVARRLVELPLVAAAFGRGELSYTKVRALCRMGTPETEADLVEMARFATGAQLERLSAGYARATRSTDAEVDDTWVRWWSDDDGYLRVDLRLAPDDGAWLQAAIDGRVEAADRVERAAGRPQIGSAERSRPVASRRADAFSDLVAQAVADPDVTDEGTGTGEAPTPEVVLVADQETLGEHPRPGAEPTRIEGGPPVSAATARRMACTCVLSVLVRGTGARILDAGHATRNPTRALRRALLHRDRHCQYPGCDRTRYLHAHHIVHWADHGPTRPDNLILLCSRHHRAVHEGGHTVEGDPQTGPVTFRGTDRAVIDRGPGPIPATTPDAITADNLAQLEDRIDQDTIRSRWDGQPLDLAYAVSCIIDTQEHRARQHRGCSAEHRDRPESG